MEGVANHDVLFQSEGPLRTPVHGLLSQPWISAHYAWSPSSSALVKPRISCDLMSCHLQESILPCPKVPLAWLHWATSVPALTELCHLSPLHAIPLASVFFICVTCPALLISHSFDILPGS